VAYLWEKRGIDEKNIRFVKPIGWQAFSSWIVSLILWFLFIIFLVDRLFKTNLMNSLFSFFLDLDGWDRSSQISIPNFRFLRVGGLHEAKEELQEIVSYFRNPQDFWRRGIKLPKGVLLVGPPGNGKTLLAKALAGECGLPFLFRSGSEFDEMVVGLGARRVRELFQEAHSYPNGCIVFIDEIDSIGRKRNDPHNSNYLTLNQLLNELDGFQPRDNVVILAATNIPQTLDSALLRPGRFDRQIYIPLPNLKARQEIIELSTQKIALSRNVNLGEIAAMTQGLSGAQIVGLFNEATILSLRYGQKMVDQEMIFEAYDRILMGPVSTSQTISPEKKRVIAYHEAGHALVGLSLPETTVKKITIVPRWVVGGYTWIALRDEKNDDNLISKNQILAQISGLLGGRVGEELFLGSECITVGAQDDFKKVSELVQSLIWDYGMSDLGITPIHKSFFWGNERSTGELSEKTKEKIAAEKEKILSKCWKKVRFILQNKRLVLSLLAEELLRKNSLLQEEINYIFINQISPFIPLLK
jgi:cell division protease FtsH